jgi:hypothetical protein
MSLAVHFSTAGRFASFELRPGGLVDTVDDLKVKGSKTRGRLKEPMATSFG